LVLDPDPNNALRVDGSGMLSPKPCCISFNDAQKSGNWGKLFVKAITVVIDQGTSPAGNHLVKNLEAIVGRSDRAAAITFPPNPSSSKDSVLTTGTPVASCDWPPVDGLKIYVYQVIGNSRQFIYNVLNPTVDANCNLSANVNVTPDIFPAGTFEATVVANSAGCIITDPPTAPSVCAQTQFMGGVGFPAPGIMVLK
jgi:hypothetical protein